MIPNSVASLVCAVMNVFVTKDKTTDIKVGFVAKKIQNSEVKAASLSNKNSCNPISPDQNCSNKGNKHVHSANIHPGDSDSVYSFL